ncbi:hypothetical protein Pryu01_02218 [Paraliobacillus ryukyuensis]|uniref:Acetyltransferase (GNAT) family protein n=1 Tax=Paraliobacillus ryukyuensis TaxID=200904 RepID=A0A366E989_9BACI|nr:GNAT family N-acetyltransferase [Paraliobacillus ryukyuensis]RBO98034.1 acetyltransferase (GNAT) family protein [Paraliobacillus ryukyuensis]
MLQDTETVRQLTLDDHELVTKMHTNIADDYVKNIFPDLVKSQTHGLFGWFQGEYLVSIAGYSLFPGGYAMLGRLRSDVRFRTNGYATKLLAHIIKTLTMNPEIKWVGANTNIHNHAARKVVDKLGMKEITKLHSYPVKEGREVKGLDGPVWNRVDDIKQKRQLLHWLKEENALGVYPYECFYPFPYTDELVTDEDLNQSTFYLNPTEDRFMVIKNDQKQEWFAQVKYFWNDHFQQEGFWNTVNQHVKVDPLQPKTRIEFSEQGKQNIPNIDVFDVSDGWVLYGR